METNTQTQTYSAPGQTVSTGLLATIEHIVRARPVILQLLKFAAIGVINAALDFLLLNVLSKVFAISVGANLGLLNIVSFSVAVIQSYAWNKAWAFGDSDTNPVKNFLHLCAIGGLGSIGVLLVLIGARLSATAVFYILLLSAFVVAELALWKMFKLSATGGDSKKNQFATFIVVSVGGLILNSVAVALVSDWLVTFIGFFGNEDVIKNVAKIVATGVSLVWNFIGYKILVFKK